MAQAQPQPTDKLNSPAHSLLHRVYSADTSAPNQSVTVSSAGNLNPKKGFLGAITVVTDTYDILATDFTVVCNKTTAFTVTLPAAVVGQFFYIKNINTGTVTVEGNGSDTIDGEANQDLLQWDNLFVQCNVANKWIIL